MSAPMKPVVFLQNLILPLLFNIRCFRCSTEYSQSAPFGSKTPYDAAFSSEELFLRNLGTSYVPPSCKPIHLNGVFRHGARNPGGKDISNVNKLFSKLKDNRTNQDFENPFFQSSEKLLSELGVKEQVALGKRLGQTYSALFNGANRNDFIFETSHKERTRESIRHLKKGLSESVNIVFDNTEDIVNDNTLRFHTQCPKYTAAVVQNDEVMKEYLQFLKSDILLEVTEKVRKKLGLPEGSLTVEEVRSLYVIASVEKGLKGHSPWIEYFDVDDLKVLQYASDLKNYWRKAYGHPVASHMSCPLIRDIVSHLENAVNGFTARERYVKGIFRSAHSETLLPLHAAFGLYKDNFKLTANYTKEEQGRVFSTSRIVPFSGNLILLLFECNTNAQYTRNMNLPLNLSWPNNFEKFMVQLLVNELPVRFPFCDFHICPFTTVVSHLQNYLSCDFESICRLNDEL